MRKRQAPRCARRGPRKGYVLGISQPPQPKGSGEDQVATTNVIAQRNITSKEALSFNTNRGADYCTGGLYMIPFLASSPSYSAEKPALEGAMVMAVGRLLPMESPVRYTLTTRDRAPLFKVDNRPTQDITRMAETCSSLTVGQHTPRGSHKARGM